MGRKRKHQRIDPVDATLVIEDMSFLGEGIAHHEGETVFVPGTVPGEVVKATIWRKTRRYLEAELKEVVTASPDRIEPPCPYFGECTGCQWQHIEYGRQLEIKAKLVRDQLRRTGGFDDPPIADPIGCDEPWGYRNHARFTVGPGGALGFVNRVHRRFVRVERCAIMDDGINGILARLQDKCEETTQLSARFGALSGSWLVQPTLQSLDIDIDSGQTHYEEELLGRRFQVAASSFFQVNIRQAQRLVELVQARLELTPDDVLVDAYAGVGTFAALLAAHVRRVIAIEESASAVTDARANFEGLDNVELIEAQTETALQNLEPPPDAVIMDPPRAGCHPEALAALCRLAPAKTVYVSCDPAALARDLKALCRDVFELVEVQPIDLFPHTHHIESVATLRPRRSLP